MPSPQLPSSDELRRIIGDVSDAKMAEILILRRTAAEVEQAVMWADNEGDIIDKSGHALEGKVAMIFDILIADDEQEPAPKPS